MTKYPDILRHTLVVVFKTLLIKKIHRSAASERLLGRFIAIQYILHRTLGSKILLLKVSAFRGGCRFDRFLFVSYHGMKEVRSGSFHDLFIRSCTA